MEILKYDYNSQTINRPIDIPRGKNYVKITSNN